MVNVPEDVDMRELCAMVQGGILTREVVVTVVYVEQSALGKYTNKYYLCMYAIWSEKKALPFI